MSQLAELKVDLFSLQETIASRDPQPPVASPQASTSALNKAKRKESAKVDWEAAMQRRELEAEQKEDRLKALMGSRREVQQLTEQRPPTAVAAKVSSPPLKVGVPRGARYSH